MTQIESIIEPDGILDNFGRKSVALVRIIWRAHSAIVAQLQLICQYQAKALAQGFSEPQDIARKCFEFVRDEIKHSWDYKLNPVTYKASDVLKHGTGYCYEKSHLLAALLRANNIPAGLCYQRLSIADVTTFCLHGLNAVYLEQFGWYRIYARGNKQGVDAEFCPPLERLAFPIVTKGEVDLPEIWAEPLPVVINALKQGKTYQEVANNLPDVYLATSNKSVLSDLLTPTEYARKHTASRP